MNGDILTLRIPHGLKLAMLHRAGVQRRSLSDVVRTALLEEFGELPSQDLRQCEIEGLLDQMDDLVVPR